MNNKKKIIIIIGIISIIVIAIILSFKIPVRSEDRIEATPYRVFKYKDYYNMYGIKIDEKPIEDEVTKLM